LSAAKSSPPKPANPTVPSHGIEELIAREESGQTILQVKFAQLVNQYRHFTLPQPSRIVLDILDKTPGTGGEESFRIDTHWVSGLRVSLSEGNLRLVTEIAAATVPAYTITPENGGLKIAIGNPDANIAAKKHLVLIQAGRRMDLRATGPVAAADTRSSTAGSAEERITTDKTYTGQKISLDFKDADIKNVFRLLAEVSGLNIVVTADVNRRVTLRLIEVPWDQAMDLLISTNGLDKEQIGNVLRISTANTFRAERADLLAAKRAREDFEPLQTVYYNLNYATAKELEPKIKSLMSKRVDAALVYDERSNTIMVRDIQKSVEDVNTLVARLDSRTPQVLIESNLIETTPTFSRSLGIEMESLFNDGRIRSSSRFIANPPFSGSPQPTPTVNQLIIPTSGFRFGYFGNNITSVLSAAEAEGNVKIISRPSVVTLNNKQSQIESANIIRIRTTAATVGEAGNLREIRAGITLKVTPQVSADGFVLLAIEAKSSTLDFGRTVDGIPQENTREAKANVLVKDGETVVLGGIMKDTSSNSDSGVPYLKDIPVVGWLFKKSSWQKDFEELVVFITPRVLTAGSENLPTAEQLWRDQLRQTQGTQAAPGPNP
ncbi:MAG TPA: type IV pilus secretin PilQ, partial [Candidatus Binatia bacterium]|nr:type IV pilus secretin PilQ [Candidatus Binatia bacterium]